MQTENIEIEKYLRLEKLGEGSKNLIQHLEAIPGAKKFEPGSNPATYMLDCIGAGTGAVELGGCPTRGQHDCGGAECTAAAGLSDALKNLERDATDDSDQP